MIVNLKTNNEESYQDVKEKNTKLSRKKAIKLSDKIEIFEEFLKTGEEIVGSTVFQGYPIGIWAMQIRSQINLIKNGNENQKRITINPTDEQLEKLEKLGILERRIDSTIDEKIDALLEFKKKYPTVDIKMSKSDSKDSLEKLKEYSKTDEEYKKIKEKYEKIQKYFDYVIHRKYQGKLSEEQIEKCKDGNVNVIYFGYPKKIEDLAEKYQLEGQDIYDILNNYGSIENFYQMYKERKINEEDVIIAKYIVRNAIDIDGDEKSKYYDVLFHVLKGNMKDGNENENVFYSSKGLKEAIGTLTERERYVIENRFGIIDGRKRTLEETGRALNGTRERVRQIEAKAIRKLRHLPRFNKARCYLDSKYLTDDEKSELKGLTEFIDNLRLSIKDVNDSDSIEKMDYIRSIKEKIDERREQKYIEQEERNKIVNNEKEIEDMKEEQQHKLVDTDDKQETEINNNQENKETTDVINANNKIAEDLTIIEKDEKVDKDIDEDTNENIEENLENMTYEQLKKIEEQNKKKIEENEKILKKETIKRILKQQEIIDEQEDELNRLNENDIQNVK